MYDKKQKRTYMEIQSLKPRRGKGTFRIDDSDDLVVMEDFKVLPDGHVCLDDHGLIIICTEGRAQFEYDGSVIQLQKNDLFLYMRHSVACNFTASSNFDCKQLWFTSSEAWNLNNYGKTSLADIAHFKLHPIVHLTDEDTNLLDSYFQLLIRRMKDRSPILYRDIVRSFVSTLMLEMLAMMRRDIEHNTKWKLQNDVASGFHKRGLVDKFMHLVEQSDGRIRKVDDFASRLNITPKYLSTIMKETMDRRPSVIIQLFTMKAIEHRLRSTDMTMQEIANDLNFPNASFFGKYFKEHSGMTPMEYRKKYHKH